MSHDMEVDTPPPRPTPTTLDWWNTVLPSASPSEPLTRPLPAPPSPPTNSNCSWLPVLDAADAPAPAPLQASSAALPASPAPLLFPELPVDFLDAGPAPTQTPKSPTPTPTPTPKPPTPTPTPPAQTPTQTQTPTQAPTPTLLGLPDAALLRIYAALAPARPGTFGTDLGGTFELACACRKLYALFRERHVVCLQFGNDEKLGGGRFFDLRFVGQALAKYPLVREVVAEKAWGGVGFDGLLSGRAVQALPGLLVFRFGMHCLYDSVFVRAIVAAAPQLRVLDLSVCCVELELVA